MKRKDYIYIGAYVLFFGFFITTLVEELTYQDEQFQKINKLNNDLLKISQYVQSNMTDFEYLEQKIEDNSVELEEVQRQLKETQDSAETFYQMFFDTQPQRVEEELVEDKVPTEEIVLETKEQEVVELPVEVPVVKITTTASCPTPHNKLLSYIEDISLRRDYSFRVSYDVQDNSIVNVNYKPAIPNKLKRGMEKYLDSFTLRGNVKDCYVPIKILGN
tara:strand:- start:27 stop:680 length:654 start_codon:yes stop_codon:yes gene_type:complete